jgi:RNA methyltransferase, TrmH family
MTLPPPITSRTNARVKTLRASFSGKASQPGELVGIEGENLIGEALRSGLTFDTIYVREGSDDVLDSPTLAGLRAEQWVLVSKDVFASAVDTASPQGIAATLVIPSVESFDPAENPGVVLVLEDLQDPGNLGTLIRSAEAFLIRQVFVTPSTVNPWNPKAIRASAGSVFRMPIVRCPLTEVKTWSDAFGARLAAAVARTKDATPVMHARLLAPCGLMIGNEGAGLSVAALALSDERVNIPCAVESLNAATAGTTMMYEAFRQNLLQEFLDMPVVRGLQ